MRRESARPRRRQNQSSRPVVREQHRQHRAIRPLVLLGAGVAFAGGCAGARSPFFQRPVLVLTPAVPDKKYTNNARRATQKIRQSAHDTRVSRDSATTSKFSQFPSGRRPSRLLYKVFQMQALANFVPPALGVDDEGIQDDFDVAVELFVLRRVTNIEGCRQTCLMGAEGGGSP